MHEASIMESALGSAAAEMRKAGAREILRMKLRVGVLSGVVPEALKFAFESLKGATPAAGAALEIELMPAVFRCLDCAAEAELEEMAFHCPRCRGCLVLDHGGNELELTQLELN
jgi:hydrogenase nickel incorporation protein HypA/HybF